MNIPGALPTFGNTAKVDREQSGFPFRMPNTSVEVPLSWAFTARAGSDLPTATQASRDKFNKELIKGYGQIYLAPADVLRAINNAHDEMKVALSSAPQWLKAGEMDIVEKLSVQRRFPPSWYLLSRPPQASKPTAEYRTAMAALCQAYGAQLPTKDTMSWAVLDSDPPDTNSGWPMFSNQMEMFMATLLALKIKKDGRNDWPSPQAWYKASQDLAMGIGVPGDIFTVGVARRAGPTRKPIMVPGFIGEGSHLSTTGCFTRSRVVYMVSRLFNMAISPLSQQVKHVRMRMFGFGHDSASRAKQISYVKEAEMQGMVVYESDFSGYDTSFSPEHRMVIYSELKRNGFQTDCLELMEMAETKWSVLSPSVDGPQAGLASVYTGRHGLLSGMKETSNLGSLHAQALVIKALVRQGLTTLDEVKRGNWPKFLNLSDDVLLIVPKSFKIAEYELSCEEEGQQTKCVEGRRMLMRHLAEGTEYSVATRILQQTLSNEDSYQYLGHAVLGLGARLSIPPHPSLMPVVKHILNTMVTGPLRDVIKSTGLDPARLVVHPSVAEFLKTAAGASWASEYLALDARPSITEVQKAITANAMHFERVLVDRADQLRVLFSAAKESHKAMALLGQQIVYGG
jgi:hypothetical protein